MSIPDTLQDQPIRKSAQRLRWFVDAFMQQRDSLSAETGSDYAVDQSVLAEAFADWLKSFDAQKPEDSGDNARYVGFAAGLMLRALVLSNPVRAVTLPANADKAVPAYFWPEGHLYVAFCLNVRGLVLEQDFAARQQPGAALADARSWWSFRENVGNDATLAIAFLDLFAGEQPNWATPGVFTSPQARSIAQDLMAPRT